MIRKLLLSGILLALFLPLQISAQEIIGYSVGAEYEYYGNQYCSGMVKTWSGGYLLTGSSDRLWVPWEPKSETSTIMPKDLILVRFDEQHEYGWKVRYGGEADDEGLGIIHHSNDGIYVAGYTKSFAGDVSGNHGGSDFWLIKTNPSNLVWQKCFGGSNDEVANTIIETPDGGLLLAGYTTSADGDISIHYGQEDIWVVKTDADGILEWEKTYGGSLDERAVKIVSTSDGGFIIAGYTTSSDGLPVRNFGDKDAWLIKLASNGEVQWQRTYGGSNEDAANDVIENANGGYTFIGTTSSDDGGVTVNSQSNDVWIVETDHQGNISWQKTFGSVWDDYGIAIRQKTNGNYILTGNLKRIIETNVQSDIWVLELDHIGELLYEGTLGYYFDDSAASILWTNDDNWMIAGTIKRSNKANVGYYKPCYTLPTDITIDPVYFCTFTTLSSTTEYDQYLWDTGETTRDNVVNFQGLYSMYGTFNGCTSRFDVIVPERHPYVHGPVIYPIIDFYNCDSAVITVDRDKYRFVYWGPQEYTGWFYRVPWGASVYVRTLDRGGCRSIKTFTLPEEPFDFFQSASFVTTDQETQKNILIFPDTLEPRIIQTDILRSYEPDGNFEWVGQLDPEQKYWVDQDSGDTNAVMYYKVTANDICGRVAETPVQYLSVALKGAKNADGTVSLSWNRPANSCISRVEVFRSVNGSEPMYLIDFPTHVQNVSDPSPPSGILSYYLRMTLSAECQKHTSSFNYAFSNKFVVSTLGEGEIAFPLMVAYPNPFTDILNLAFMNLNPSGLIELYDQMGSIVFTANILNAQKTSFHLGHLPAGVYFLQYFYGQHRQTFKVLKMNQQKQ
jgi:hypothetical protein